ncbi:hypothetical protein M6D93_17645 [Jatrophihabitans telluris]|uniref:Gasdermin bGSDM n=1 Tax=Jatrophihabitans telluris TaxID=2038343 RepID=A0ABY4QZ23_9ACTN|nr:hypothetical protein [Jatrophihabitans telluris]UQX88096.1 hypothetical protein M6D93_17645 [Jatrophihabitans telluris]
MGFRACRHEDPFTRRVRDLYGANVVAAPRTGIDPLRVLAVRNRRVQDRGLLPAFLTSPQELTLPPVQTQQVAGLQGTRSAGLDVEGGLALTGTFLQALGLPIPGGELKTSLWKGATSVEFEVREVRQHQVDVGALGAAVTGLAMNRAQPAAAVFFDPDPDRMLIVTRTLTSTGFAVRCTDSGAQSIEASVDAISDVLGKADVGVSWNRESSDVVSFHGPVAVTFAFGAIGCTIQPDGTVLFGREADDLRFGAGRQDSPALVARPVVDEDGLLVLDG